MESIEITGMDKQLAVKNACIDGSTFDCVSLAGSTFFDVNMSNIKISNANMSDFEIEGAGLGGAYIHNIGMPPEGHPMYNPAAKQKPLKFEDCNLESSIITNCNLTGVEITDCNLSGLKINGVLIEDLINNHTVR